MIIFEGPDGAGKSTLIKRLSSDLPLPVAPRASTSEGGPVANLFEWVYRDIKSWQSQAFIKIYDRYPLVSDYIYGPIIRGAVAEGLDSQAAYEMRDFFQAHTFTVFCMPPLEVVRENLAAGKQMPGVVDHIEDIYDAYLHTIIRWKGPFFIWDYTNRNAEVNYRSLCALLLDYTNTREEIQ